jgi:hypothetical protein
MTGVTAQTVVNVISDFTVFFVHPGLLMLVTCRATKDAVIGRVGMAFAARIPLAAVRTAVNGEIVCEGCAAPLRGVVTRCTARRKSGSDMIGIRYRRVFRSMAIVAVRRCARELVVQVAIGALHGDVGSRQRKLRLAVVECRPQPLRCPVTELAVLWETGRHVTWVRCLVEVFKMAGDTR